MPEAETAFEPTSYVLPLLATIFFIALNGFFVAAEFALVKVRASRIESLAEDGSRAAQVTRHILRHLNRYLSACQLGITLASLILGWLAEPAVAELLLAGVASFGGTLSPNDPIVHGVALLIALAVITGLHMIFGEQAPKIWAIHRAESAALLAAYPLSFFATVCRPLIWVINGASNRLLRLLGLTPEQFHETIHDVGELKYIVSSAAQAGHISARQSQLAQNVFGIIGLEARHILVPRVDVSYLSLQKTFAQNVEVIRDSGHSRYPLCENDLDSVVGIVHTKDLFRPAVDGSPPVEDLRTIMREVVFVPETQPLSRVILTMQNTRSHVVVVVDEHGSSVGLAFLEDALEQIVGPLADEFDVEEARFQLDEDGTIRMAGSVPLPTAVDRLGLVEVDPEAAPETIAGLVTAELGRLPRVGDSVRLGAYTATVEKISGRRVQWLRLVPREVESASEHGTSVKT